MVLLRRHEYFHPGPGHERAAARLAIERGVVETGDRLGDDEEASPEGADRLDAVLHQRLAPELIELVHQEHDRVGLVGARLSALQRRDALGEEQSNQRRQCGQVLGLRGDVERLRLAAETGQIEVVLQRRADHRRIIPKLEAGTIDHRAVAVGDLLAHPCHLRKDRRDDGDVGHLGVLAVRLLGLAATPENLLGKAEVRPALLDGKEAGSNEEPLAGLIEALGRISLHDQELVGQDIERSILLVGRRHGRDPRQRVEAMRPGRGPVFGLHVIEG